jgi:hypothetical protein
MQMVGRLNRKNLRWLEIQTEKNNMAGNSHGGKFIIGSLTWREIHVSGNSLGGKNSYGGNIPEAVKYTNSDKVQ